MQQDTYPSHNKYKLNGERREPPVPLELRRNSRSVTGVEFTSGDSAVNKMGNKLQELGMTGGKGSDPLMTRVTRSRASSEVVPLPE